MREWALRLGIFSALVFAFSLGVQAQSESTSNPASQDQQGKKDDSSATAANQQEGDQAAPSPTPAYPVDAQIHAAGKAMPWVGTNTALHWGPFSIGGFDAFTVYDQFYPSAGGPSDIARLEVFRTGFTFDKTYKKSRFLLQYTPELIMLNGHARGSALGNNGATIGNTYELSSRFSLTLKDDFGQFRSRQMFSDQLLLVDKQNGSVVQGYFLENNGTHLQNTFSAVLNYKVTPRLVLTVAPSYTYAETKSPADIYIVNDSANVVGLTYALSPRRNLGFVQSVEILDPIRPVSGNGVFHSSGLFYSEQLAPTWWITGKVGAEAATYPGFQQKNWAVDGSFTLMKTFVHSDLAMLYYRGSTLTNFVTNRQTDRADISYGIHIRRSVKWSNSVGYFRTVGGDPSIIGKYALSRIDYRLPGGFSIFSSYMRQAQRSSTIQLISGDRNIFIAGIHWESAAVPAH
ncbi:MAG: hypothetical protein AUI53_00340 [Acidobacteria bacterium 13_1_40CM_2_60_7]|nr:MAG: hypothetical protein AUI53_00340 [Acidobacteria bacterium 13_1_40CM_2_60_7]OLE83011.1 MAG: hypothetical protein AUG07_09125 [Acidobacteria bacterium 13_1_20CM_2_60_10]PYU08194.1 MAG: hypothetical protein DMG33_02345 [Acidobacteriota bacterium]